jgi:hypothetical protein
MSINHSKCLFFQHIRWPDTHTHTSFVAGSWSNISNYQVATASSGRWRKRFACFFTVLVQTSVVLVLKIYGYVDSPTWLWTKVILVNVILYCYVSISCPWLNYCEGFTLLAGWIRLLSLGLSVISSFAQHVTFPDVTL